MVTDQCDRATVGLTAAFAIRPVPRRLVGLQRLQPRASVFPTPLLLRAALIRRQTRRPPVPRARLVAAVRLSAPPKPVSGRLVSPVATVDAVLF